MIVANGIRFTLNKDAYRKELKSNSDIIEKMSYKDNEKCKDIKTDKVILNDIEKDTVPENFKDRIIEMLQNKYQGIYFFDGNKTVSEKINERLSVKEKEYTVYISEDFFKSLLERDSSSERWFDNLDKVIEKLIEYGKNATAIVNSKRAYIFEIKEKKSAELFVEKNNTDRRTLPSPAELEANKIRMSGVLARGVSGSYMRMAQARTKPEVQMIMQEIRRDINGIKFLSTYGDDKERIQAKKMIAALEKLLQRGNRKIRSFEEEQLVDIKRKRALEEKNREKAIQAQLELEKMKTSRRIRDGVIQKEGQLTELDIPGYRNRNDNEINRKLYDEYYMYTGAFIQSTSEISPEIAVVVQDCIASGSQLAEVVEL